MVFVFILIALFCGIQIIRNSGQTRFNWVVCSILLLSSGIRLSDKPQIACHSFLIWCFWCSVLIKSEHKRKKFPLRIPLAIYAIGIIVVGLNSQYLSVFYKFYKPIKLLLDTYFVVLLAYYGTSKCTFKSTAIVSTVYIVTIYGVLTWILYSNPIQELIVSVFGSTVDNSYYFGDRLRITSTWNHPIAYGMVLSGLLYIYLPSIKEKKILFLIALIILNIFLCGSRTALAAMCLMAAIIIPVRYNLKKATKQCLVLAMLAIPIYIAVPLVHEKVDSVLLSAKGKDDVEGSSLDMREMQTEYAMLMVANAPVMGHGLSYISEELGYNTNKYKGDRQMLGFESIVYIILIERGFFGLFLEILILLSMAVYALRNRNGDRINSSYIAATLVGWTFFSVFTGSLDTPIPIFMMIGYSFNKLQEMAVLKKKLTPPELVVINIAFAHSSHEAQIRRAA